MENNEKLEVLAFSDNNSDSNEKNNDFDNEKIFLTPFEVSENEHKEYEKLCKKIKIEQDVYRIDEITNDNFLPLYGRYIKSKKEVKGESEKNNVFLSFFDIVLKGINSSWNRLENAKIQNKYIIDLSGLRNFYSKQDFIQEIIYCLLKPSKQYNSNVFEKTLENTIKTVLQNYFHCKNNFDELSDKEKIECNKKVRRILYYRIWQFSNAKASDILKTGNTLAVEYDVKKIKRYIRKDDEQKQKELEEDINNTFDFIDESIASKIADNDFTYESLADCGLIPFDNENIKNEYESDEYIERLFKVKTVLENIEYTNITDIYGNTVPNLWEIIKILNQGKYTNTMKLLFIDGVQFSYQNVNTIIRRIKRTFNTNTRIFTMISE